jgi:PIN domain
METDSIAHFVFVDFENVPEVDLDLIGDRPVMVRLLIGKNQKKLDLALVQQIRRHAVRVELTEVGATGHNALDLTLAYYLGQAALQAPHAQFHVVSKDKDFEPLIAHLRAEKVRVFRHDTFAALSFLPQPKITAFPKGANPQKTAAPVDKFEKLIAHFQNTPASRPKKRTKLLAHINTTYGGKLSEAQQNEVAEKLIARGVITIDAAGKVSDCAPPSTGQG